jgi:hypothetical protein
MKAGISMNWSSVTITPIGGGTALTITDATDVAINEQSANQVFRGGANQWPKLIRTGEKSATVRISMPNAEAVMKDLDPDKKYTIVAILDDAINGAGEGAITFDMAPATLSTRSTSGQNNRFASPSLSFDLGGRSNDATPIEITVEGAGP